MGFGHGERCLVCRVFPSSPAQFLGAFHVDTQHVPSPWPRGFSASALHLRLVPKPPGLPGTPHGTSTTEEEIKNNIFFYFIFFKKEATRNKQF